MRNVYKVPEFAGHSLRTVGMVIVLLVGWSVAKAQSNYAKYGLPVLAAAPKSGGKAPSALPPTTARTTSLTNGQGDDVRLLATANQQSEAHLTIDKSNPCNLIASANTLVGGAVQQGYYYSRDGGVTWLGDDRLPNGAPGAGDPSTAYDASGIAYIATMTAGPNGYAVQSSADKGVTWTNQVRAAGPTANFDKEMIVADNTTSSPYVNNLYAAWTNFSGSTTVEFNRSTNGGGYLFSAHRVEEWIWSRDERSNRSQR